MLKQIQKSYHWGSDAVQLAEFPCGVHLISIYINQAEEAAIPAYGKVEAGG